MNEFNQWNIQKQNLHFNGKGKFCHERDIWWCSLGVNIGFEQNGDGLEHRRPVIIIKGLSKDTCLVAPLTSSKNQHPLRIPLGIINDLENSVLLSQIKTIDTRRLVSKIGRLDSKKFDVIRKAIKDLL